jgi:hypothetical protein
MKMRVYKHTLSTKLTATATAVMTFMAITVALMMPVTARAQNNPVQKATSSVLVTGTTTAGDVFNGILHVSSVAADPATGALTASGTLTGTITSAAGTVLGTVSQTITAPLASVSGSCTILTLTLGPLDLNLLGLMVHLNQVVLNITAQPGPGNLLGNLLCSVANLLNGGNLSGVLSQLVSLLNQILSSL